MLEVLLKKFGLSENEISIFICTYKNKKITAAKISRLTFINRTTVYTVLKILLGKKLIIEDLAGKSARYFSPISLSEMDNLLEIEEKKINYKKITLNKIKEELLKIKTIKGVSIPKIRYVGERDIKDFLINQSEKWLRSSESIDSTWWGFQDITLIKEYPEWPKYFFSNFPKKTKLKILTNKNLVDIKMKKKYQDRSEVKYIQDEKFTATNIVIGDYLIMVVTNKHPHYLIEIHDSVMAHNNREIFKKLWENIK